LRCRPRCRRRVGEFLFTAPRHWSCIHCLEIHYGPVRTERPAALCSLEQSKARWSEVAPTPEGNLAIRIRLRLAHRLRELALVNLAVDSKLRSCDLVKLRVRDVTRGDHVASRAIVIQPKTQRLVQFEITEQTRESLTTWISCASRHPEDCLFPSRLRSSPHLSTRQYGRIVRGWVREIGLNPPRTAPIRCAAPMRR